MNSVNIRPIERVDISDAVALLVELNPDTPATVVEQRLEDILDRHPNYQIFGAFEDSELLGVCSAWLATKIWCGQYLEVDNLVVREDQRSRGVGSMLIEHMERMGREQDCKIVVLDSYTANHASHRLYHRLGFEIWGFHFVKPVGDWVGNEMAV